MTAYGRQYTTGNTLDVVLLFGHSIAQGANVDPSGSVGPPPGIPTPAIDFFRHCELVTGPETVLDTQVTQLKLSTYSGGTVLGASEFSMGLAYYTSVVRLAILKIAIGGTMYSDWVEGGSQNAFLQAGIAAFRAAIPTIYPLVNTIRYRRVTFLGANEAQLSVAACNGMPALATTLRAQTETYLGQALTNDIVIRESSSSAVTFLSAERTNQATLATNLGATLVNTDDIIGIPQEQSDQIHPTAAGQNAIGARVGGILAAGP